MTKKGGGRSRDLVVYLLVTGREVGTVKAARAFGSCSHLRILFLLRHLPDGAGVCGNVFLRVFAGALSLTLEDFGKHIASLRTCSEKRWPL